MNNSLLKKWKFMNNLHLTLTKKISYLQISLRFCGYYSFFIRLSNGKGTIEFVYKPLFGKFSTIYLPTA